MSEASAKAAGGRLPLRVLVVEDDPMVRRMFTRVVGRLVDHVEDAADGQEALERLLQASRAERPDLVLSDLAMPRLNGIELARRLHELDEPLPVVMVTAYDPPQLVELLGQGVVAGLLTKPPSLPSLRALLERHASGVRGVSTSEPVGR